MRTEWGSAAQGTALSRQDCVSRGTAERAQRSNRRRRDRSPWQVRTSASLHSGDCRSSSAVTAGRVRSAIGRPPSVSGCAPSRFPVKPPGGDRRARPTRSPRSTPLPLVKLLLRRSGAESEAEGVVASHAPTTLNLKKVSRETRRWIRLCCVFPVRCSQRQRVDGADVSGASAAGLEEDRLRRTAAPWLPFLVHFCARVSGFP
jgi:hypothetical protein